MWKICVVVPTRNEERTIERVLNDIRGALDPAVYAPPVILVVDDSTDRTRELVAQAGAVVLIGGGRGLGSAMFDGLKAAVRHKPDFIVSVDGDGQAEGAEIPRFLKPLIDGQADLVIGSRFADRGLIDYRYRMVNRLGTIVLARILRGFTGLPITDSHGGLRAMRPEVAGQLEMLGTHTYVQETIIDAAEKGFRIVEIPSAWKKRGHGKSRVVGSIPRYVFYTLPILLLRSGQHVRMLYSGGILLVLAGFAYFFVVLAQSGFHIKETFNRIPAFIFIALLISIGMQFFFFGLVLQLLKQLKYQVDRVGQRASARRAAARRRSPAVSGRR